MRNLKLGSAGAVIGLFAGATIAFAVMALVPEFGHAPRIEYLSRDLGWAVAFSSPFGVAAGVLMGGYLQQRSQHVATFRQLIIESQVVVIIATIALAQLVIPASWDLPRLKITTIMVVGACLFSIASTWLLRPVYWRRER